MKIIAFAASTNKNSINKMLIQYSVKQLQKQNSNIDIEIIDLNDFSLPIYSQDLENSLGIPQLATNFFNKLGSADALLISFAEHNGNYTASYKNLFDWCSRISPKVYQGKRTIALATSPGKHGGKSVISMVKNSAKFFACDLIGEMSIGNFYDIFDQKNLNILDINIKKKLDSLLEKIVNK